MPQIGGKPKKTSSDMKRHFTVVIDRGGKGGTKVPPKEHGLYVSSTPSSAAKKTVTKLCTANKSKKVEFSIREITQGSKKKTYGPYKGYIEKLKEPIELKGRVIKYKPVAKLGKKKSVQKDGQKDGKKDGKKGGKKGGQKGGHKFKYNDDKDKEYRAIHKKLTDDQNFLTEQEKDNLGFNNPIKNKFFTKATTYLWTLKPNGYKDFNEESDHHEDQKYYYGILRIKPNAFFKNQSIYIAFRVNISKRKLKIPKKKQGYYWERYWIENKIYLSETIIELTFLAKGFGKEEFRRHLLRINPVAPIYNNRDRTIAELIKLIQTKKIYEYDKEFSDLQIYFKENMSQLTNSFANVSSITVSPLMQKNSSAQPVTMNKKRNQIFLMSDLIPKILMPKIHGTEIVVDPKFKKSAPITQEALNFIKKYAAGSSVLEIGCGSGIYAKLLRENGVKIIASDACRINNEGLPDLKYRMANFTNQRAIPNIICKNAVTAVVNYGQNSNLSLFLSFPLPHDYNSESNISYDEAALRNFKGNKFFLIALYKELLSNTENYSNSIWNDSTGSHEFHDYLAREWNVKDKLLLSSGGFLKKNCYLIYFERKK
jgi:hypothetical protein